jgi:hypothetical protein
VAGGGNDVISLTDDSEIVAFIDNEINNLSDDEAIEQKKSKKRRLPKPNLTRLKVDQYEYLSDDHKRRQCKSKRLPGLFEKAFIVVIS